MIEFIIHRLRICAAGPNLKLDTLILEWLADQPGFADFDPDPDLPLHLYIAGQQTADRFRQHAFGLVGHPHAAAQLRDHLCPDADRWVRRSGEQFVAAVYARHRWYEATSRDEAAAIISAAMRAHVAGQWSVRAANQEAPLYAVAAE